jgi:hypothetical protein
MNWLELLFPHIFELSIYLRIQAQLSKQETNSYYHHKHSCRAGEVAIPLFF